MIGVVDYGGGNIQSVRNTLKCLGEEFLEVSAPEHLEQVTALLFPGQGAFADSMAGLHERSLVPGLQAWLHADKPFFGICIGYQLLFDESEENPGVPGLGIFRGRVIRFPADTGAKIPHMGWNNAEVTAHTAPWPWQELGTQPFFYFVHSYYPEPEDATLAATLTDYAGKKFVSSIQRGNLCATQFHPEKSQDNGLGLIRNFVEKYRVV